MVTVNHPHVAVAASRRSEEPDSTPAAALSATAATDAAVPSLRHFVQDTAARWAVPTETIDGLSLVVTELVTNVVLHSGSPDVTVLITHHGAEVHLEVKDAGTWQTRTTPRLVPEDDDAACGRGLDLVKHCCSWWLAFLSPLGTRVVACLPVAANAG
ncbi:ATP-binding protein [Streptomyces sp. NPDC101160]|uniref:ATP-binding protein n=1 Tax=Streptomyces sp. NPDC101160 TaxID=3366118 RepID=UPI00382EEE0F